MHASNMGNYFDDFVVGDEIEHSFPKQFLRVTTTYFVFSR